MNLPPDSPEGPELAPPGVRAMAAVRWAFIVIAAVAALGTWTAYGTRGQRSPGASELAAPKYHCSMHPQITSNEPGQCPICGMDLVPIEPTTPSQRPSPDAAIAAREAHYTCPMHPEVVQDHPGNCPVCKMALERAEDDAGAPDAVPPGLVPIDLSLDRQQSIGVRVERVEERVGASELRVAATVAAPEQGVAEVHVRTPGFVERISVRETGVRVRAGSELFAMYSPEVFQAEAELLAARTFGNGGQAVAGIRQKLELLGMAPATIDEVLATGKPVRAIPVLAPATGFVTKKQVVLGSYVVPETALYEVTDLSRMYVIADVSPRDIDAVRVGTEGTYVPADAATSYRTKVDLVYPQVAMEARTTRVRMQVTNPGAALRPGQYGYVTFAMASRKVVAIPRGALVDIGADRYVFVAEGDGHFTPRRVRTGAETGERVEVLEGLRADERVVASATFLVDSESRLRASLARVQSPPEGGAR
jgi:Cu(I)/Ag(I) efflux system membrane fusion protein